METELHYCLEEWRSWLNDLLASGAAFPANALAERARAWAAQAHDLGLHHEAQLADLLFSSNENLETRAKLLAELLVREDLLRHTYNHQFLLAELREGKNANT